MKVLSSSAIALLTVFSSYNGELLAQSCLNCWINPQTGQQESLDYLIPRPVPQNEPSPTVSESLSPEEEKKEDASTESEADQKEDSPDSETDKEEDNPIFDEPIDRLEEEEEPQPLPRTQIEPRLRYRQRNQ
ncbi:MAG: hypothetical protein AB4058_06565 [Microcystaceae cyanobacterium]